MTFGSLFRRNRIELTWEYSTAGSLWRLLPANSRYFIGEDRNPVNKQVKFFCLDYQTGEALWNTNPLTEQWWVGMEVIVQDMLLLHEYASPDMPEHKGMHAIDIRSGRKTWTDHERSFVAAYGSSLFACRVNFDSREFVEIDIHTGDVLREVSREELAAMSNVENANNSVDISFPVSPESQSSEIQVIIRKSIGDRKLHGSIDVFLADSKAVLAYYEELPEPRIPPRLRQKIHIVDSASGKTLYDDSIVSEAMVPVPESFFAIDGFIYYIADRKHLRAINLNS